MTETWKPANDIERELARVLAEDQRSQFFQILLTADLHLPQVASDGDGEEQTFVTGEAFGQTVLPVYTSVEGLAANVAGVADAYVTTGYAELREKWPRPEWQLAINPGLPIDAYLPIDAVEAAARGDLRAVTVGEAIVEGMAEDETASALLDVEEAMRTAAARGDANGFLDSLLDALVLVPTEHDVSESERMAWESGFPWRLAAGRTMPTIEAFTSQEIFAWTYPAGAPAATVPMAFLLGVWPSGHALSVNPGSDLSLELPPEQVQALLLLAAGEDGR